jgi:PAS domain S-box-containing protein
VVKILTFISSIVSKLFVEPNMRHPSPTNREVMFDDDTIIVSKTDTKGKITYCNEIFMEVSGYEEEELLDRPHSILRHPDMPKAIFKLLWDSIQSKNEINAYVKNLCKDGSHYWVFANVTPSYNAKNEVIGYFSVRRKPRKEAMQIIQPIYEELLRIEKASGMDASIEHLLNLLKEKGMTYEEFILSF